jgi:hypothetical protein
MKQVYQNLSDDRPIECIFYFPLNIGFTLSKIRMELVNMNDPNVEPRIIETVIEERKLAEQKFEDAIVEGTTMPIIASYTKDEGSSKILFNLGNFPPKTTATLTCFMSGPLEKEAGNRVFRLPLTFIPKYVLDQKVEI